MTAPKVGDLKIETWYQAVIVISVFFLFVGLTQNILICKNEYIVQISFGALIISLANWMELKHVTKLEPYRLGFLKISWSQMFRTPATVLMKLIGIVLITNPFLEYFFRFSILQYLKF